MTEYKFWEFVTKGLMLILFLGLVGSMYVQLENPSIIVPPVVSDDKNPIGATLDQMENHLTVSQISVVLPVLVFMYVIMFSPKMGLNQNRFIGDIFTVIIICVALFMLLFVGGRMPQTGI